MAVMGRPPRAPKDVEAAKLIGSRIRSSRKAKNLTQKRLAELMELTESAVCDWEKGRSTPTGTRLPRLAQVLGVSTGFLSPSKLPERDGIEQRAAELATKVGPRLLERMLEMPTHPLRVVVGHAIEDYHSRQDKDESEEQSS
jgi:transcriptional regulator with XRE-family HTH domain